MVTSAEHEASEGQNVGRRPVTAVVTSEAGAHSKRDRKSLRGFSAGELYDLMNTFQTAFRTLRGVTAGAAGAGAARLSRGGPGVETGAREAAASMQADGRPGPGAAARCRVRGGWAPHGDPGAGPERRSGCPVASEGMC